MKSIDLQVLPYSFKRRLIDLQSLNTLAEFAPMCSESTKLANRRGYFAERIWVINDPVLKERLERGHRSDTIIDSNRFLAEKKPCYAYSALTLQFNSPYDFKKSQALASGKYSFLRVNGTYFWGHVDHFIHKDVTRLIMQGNMLINESHLSYFADWIAWLVKHHEGFFCEININYTPVNMYWYLWNRVVYPGAQCVFQTDNYIRVSRTLFTYTPS